MIFSRAPFRAGSVFHVRRERGCFVCRQGAQSAQFSIIGDSNASESSQLGDKGIAWELGGRTPGLPGMRGWLGIEVWRSI